MPNSSAVDGEDEVGVAVGQDALHRALARSLAEPAALHEALDGVVDLERVARCRVEEAVDARGHMRQQRVGGEQAEHAEAAEAQHPEQVQPRQEDEPAPHAA